MPSSAIRERNISQARLGDRSTFIALVLFPLLTFTFLTLFQLSQFVPLFPSSPSFFYCYRLQMLLNQTLTLYWAQTKTPEVKRTLFSNIRHCFQSVRPEQGAITKPWTKHVLSNASWSQIYIFPMVCRSFFGTPVRVFKETGTNGNESLSAHPATVLFLVNGM